MSWLNDHTPFLDAWERQMTTVLTFANLVYHKRFLCEKEPRLRALRERSLS